MKVALLLSVKIAELTVFARQCSNFLVVEKETFLIADSTFFCVRPLFGKVRLTTTHAVIEHCWRETDKIVVITGCAEEAAIYCYSFRTYSVSLFGLMTRDCLISLD